MGGSGVWRVRQGAADCCRAASTSIPTRPTQLSSRKSPGPKWPQGRRVMDRRPLAPCPQVYRVLGAPPSAPSGRRISAHPRAQSVRGDCAAFQSFRDAGDARSLNTATPVVRTAPSASLPAARRDSSSITALLPGHSKKNTHTHTTKPVKGSHAASPSNRCQGRVSNPGD